MHPKNSSFVNLIKGKVSFTNEPLWYRLIVIALIAIFIICVIYLLKSWTFPTIVAKGLSGIKLKELFKFGKGKSP